MIWDCCIFANSLTNLYGGIAVAGVSESQLTNNTVLTRYAPISTIHVTTAQVCFFSASKALGTRKVKSGGTIIRANDRGRVTALTD